MQNLKHVFIELLIETSKDFSLRNVPRGRQFIDLLPPTIPRALVRQSSRDRHEAPPLVRSRSARWQQEVGDAMLPGAPPELVRELSDDLTERFREMRTWYVRTSLSQQSTHHPSKHGDMHTGRPRSTRWWFSTARRGARLTRWTS